MPEASPRKLLVLLAAIAALTALVFTTAAGGASPSGPPKYSELPDPMKVGPHNVVRTDPLKLGTTTFQEPNSAGEAPVKSNESITAFIRGVMFQPKNFTGESPLILLVHGNHGSCDPPAEGKETVSGPKCDEEKNKAEEKI